MSNRNRSQAGRAGQGVDFCDSCAKVSDARRRSDGILEAARVQALQVSGRIFR